MKHIGWCLEELQRILAKIPRYLKDTEDDSKERSKANTIVNRLQEVVNTLEQIVLNPKFEKYIKRLEQAPIHELQMQGEKIEHLLHELVEFVGAWKTALQHLRKVIIQNPEVRREETRHLSYDIQCKFGNVMCELNEEFKQAVHTEEELREAVNSEQHLEEFLK